MSERQTEPSSKKRSPESIEDWAESKSYLKWPLFIIIILVFILMIFISIYSPEN